MSMVCNCSAPQCRLISLRLKLRTRVPIFYDRAAGPRAIGSKCFLPLLRTDSVNLGICISLFTREMIVSAISVGVFFFVILRI